MLFLPPVHLSPVACEYMEAPRPSTLLLELCLDLCGSLYGNVSDNAICLVLYGHIEAYGLSVPLLELCLGLYGSLCSTVLDIAKGIVLHEHVGRLSVPPLELCLDGLVLHKSSHGTAPDNAKCSATLRKKGSFNLN